MGGSYLLANVPRRSDCGRRGASAEPRHFDDGPGLHQLQTPSAFAFAFYVAHRLRILQVLLPHHLPERLRLRGKTKLVIMAVVINTSMIITMAVVTSR